MFQILYCVLPYMIFYIVVSEFIISCQSAVYRLLCNVGNVKLYSKEMLFNCDVTYAIILVT